MSNKISLANRILKNNLYFLIGLVLSLLLLWPLARSGYFSHHDDVQVVRLYEMDKCFKDAQIPCRWVPDLGGGYGYPLFNYYAPLPYYVGEIFYLVTGNFLIAAKLMFAFSFILSYVFMYLLGRKLWGKLGGSLSAIFYAYIPYHAVNMYVRGAMGELFAMALFPLVFYFFVRFLEKTNLKNSIWLACAIVLLVTSHNISAMIFLPLLVVFLLFKYLKEKKRELLLWFALGIILSFFLSAFYLLPALVEKKYVHVETMTSGYFSYTEHFKGLRKLLIDRSWSWGSSIREVPGGERDQMPYQIGWVHLGALVLSLVTLFHYHGRPKPLGFWIVIFSTIVSTLSVFMIHPRSVYVWKALDPFLKYLQFPWRFLILISFFVSLASGGVFLWLKKREALVWGVLVIAVVALNFSYFRPEKFISVTQDDYLSGEIWDKQIKRSIFDYLPIYALMPPAELSTSDYQIVTGIAQIENFKKSSNKISFSVNAKVPSQIMLSQYYFPGWKIKVNGTNTKIDYQNDLGLMTIEVNPGVSSVEARFTNTPIRVLGNGLTVVAGVGIITFLGYRKFKNKK